VEFACGGRGGGLQRPVAGRRPWCRSRGAANSALQARPLATLAEYSRATHQDQHSVELDYDVFVNVKNWTGRILKTVQQALQGGRFRFSAQAGSAAVDKGVILHNVTDGFTGAAPDLVRLEAGKTPPHYGHDRNTQMNLPYAVTLAPGCEPLNSVRVASFAPAGGV
jgi:hypothetical protein